MFFVPQKQNKKQEFFFGTYMKYITLKSTELTVFREGYNFFKFNLIIIINSVEIYQSILVYNVIVTLRKSINQ